MLSLRNLSLALLLSFVASAGCFQNGGADVSNARADAEAARTEAASLRTELAKVKGELTLLRSDATQARSVAEGFLTAVTNSSVDQLHGFCTAGQRGRVNSVTMPAGKVSWSITAEVVGGNGREATFKGRLDLPSSAKQEFVVLVIKTAESGPERWLVDAFSLGG